jgi:hypothetical protein
LIISVHPSLQEERGAFVDTHATNPKIALSFYKWADARKTVELHCANHDLGASARNIYDHYENRVRKSFPQEFVETGATAQDHLPGVAVERLAAPCRP